MFDRAAQYENVINLGIGEPDFITPPLICDAGKEALDKGYTHYTANAGLIELRNLIACQPEFSELQIDPASEVIVTIGGMGALALCTQVLLDDGDEVLLPDPSWLNYRAQIHWAGGRPVPVPTSSEKGFCICSEDISAHITERTRAILLNSPANPTGMVIPVEELKKIAALAAEKDLVVIMDEVYSTLIYDHPAPSTILAFPGMKERTVIINSFSKSFAMTGWRVGYAVGPKELIWKMTILQENFNSCAAAPCQKAASFAMKHWELAEEMRQEYQLRRNLIVNRLQSMQHIACLTPDGAFYVFPNVEETGLTSEDFCMRLLEEEQVVCVPGTAFGACGQGHIRISYANSRENLKEAADRIERFIKGL